MRRIFALMMGVMVVLGGLGLVLVPEEAGAVDNVCDDEGIPDELKEAAGCKSGDDRNETIMPIVTKVIEVVLGIVGIIAVIVLVYGAIVYTTSTGDARKVYQAKNIILYAIVGLVISSLAYAIVYFVSQAIWGEVG